MLPPRTPREVAVCAAAVTGPYLKRIFVKELGLPETAVMNAEPSVDFNGASSARSCYGSTGPH